MKNTAHSFTEAAEYTEPENNIEEFLKESKQDIIPDSILKALGFKYHEMTIEDDFKYDYWTLCLMGVRVEITNQYDLEDNFTGQVWEINDTDITETHSKEKIYQLIETLKP